MHETNYLLGMLTNNYFYWQVLWLLCFLSYSLDKICFYKTKIESEHSLIFPKPCNGTSQYRTSTAEHKLNGAPTPPFFLCDDNVYDVPPRE